MSATAIERIERPTPAVFLREYVQTGKPVILRNGLGSCKASTWTPEYLRSVVGHRKLPVATSSRRHVFSYTTDGSAFGYRELDFATALGLLQQSSDVSYYVMQIPVHLKLPELTADIELPPLVSSSELRSTNLWVSAADTLTPLHFDSSNNLLAQVYGSKRVTLYAPEHSSAMYPYAPWTSHPHVSEVDFKSPDPQRFPLFTRAAATTAILEAGDVLFLPAFWWHAVETLALSISLNFWWRIHPWQLFAPIVLQRLVWMFDRSRISQIEVQGKGLIEAASHALSHDKPLWTAVLLAAAALERCLRQALTDHGIEVKAIPRRLDALSARLAQIDPDIAIEATRIQRWNHLVHEAHRCDDRLLARAEVAEMVQQIDRSWVCRS